MAIWLKFRIFGNHMLFEKTLCIYNFTAYRSVATHLALVCSFKLLTLLGLLSITSATTAIAETSSANWLWTAGGYTSKIDRSSSVDETEIYMLPLSLKWRSGKRWAKLAGSWVAVKGPGNVDTASDTYDNSLDRDTLGSENGVGDLYLSAGQFFSYPLSDRKVWLELSGKYKLPLADFDKGLGTGEADTTLTGSIFYPLQRSQDNPWFKPQQLYTKLSYAWRGDPDSIDLENRPTLLLGAVFRPSTQWQWGGHWQWQDRTVANGDAKRKLFIYASIKMRKSEQISERKTGIRQNRGGILKWTPFLLFDAESPNRELGLGLNISSSL